MQFFCCLFVIFLALFWEMAAVRIWNILRQFAVSNLLFYNSEISSNFSTKFKFFHRYLFHWQCSVFSFILIDFISKLIFWHFYKSTMKNTPGAYQQFLWCATAIIAGHIFSYVLIWSNTRAISEVICTRQDITTFSLGRTYTI